MIKKLMLLKYWIFNLFIFSKPVFYELEYVDFILNNKPVFLVSWKINKAYQMRILGLNFRSYESTASAYIAVPIGVNEIKIKISNSWRSRVKKVKLLRLLKVSQIEFNLQPNFDEFKKIAVSIPNIHFPKTPIRVKSLKSCNVKINLPKIINLIK